MVETVDNLTERFSDQLAADLFAGLREKLMARHQAILDRIVTKEKALEEVAATIETARRRVDDWPVDQKGFAAIRGGLQRVYKRGYKRLAEAYAEPVPKNFHQWRKRVKYLWYHTRILKPLWPNVLAELADELHNLSDYLGDDHDLAELRQTVTAQAELVEDKRDLQVLVALIDRRRTELEAAARPLGERIYAEKAADFVDRFAAYWSVWQNVEPAKIGSTEATLFTLQN